MTHSSLSDVMEKESLAKLKPYSMIDFVNMFYKFAIFYSLKASPYSREMNYIEVWNMWDMGK